MGRIRLGKVTAYEPERGLGRLLGEDGEELSFHCTAISDGSRQVEVGTPVAYLADPAQRGRYEASEVVKLA